MVICTSTDTVYDGCPVLHVLPETHSHQDALLIAVIRHACVAALQGVPGVPVTVEVVSPAA